ncbi:MAG: hypothetical protein R3C39_02745 [Dehalococcoidia bacterium]
MDGPGTLLVLMAFVAVAAGVAVGLRRTRWFAGWRGIGLVLAIGVASAVLHNVVYGLFDFEEAVFFFVAIVAAFALPIMAVLQLSEALRRR